MKLPPETTPVEPTGLLIRFHNQLGAAVDITGTHSRARWSCHGCGDTHSEYSLRLTRASANEHANTCRAAYHHTC
ncbi:hypothetical protein ABZX75_11760 [Streptomyces sp. NPDC003038]|uniref:hypothetical protein n=1 Tax=unclassified Streptomyces TaxID=2593676 RepID=UPI0033B4F2AB